MIFEGSCETDDWSNDAENSALASQGINSIFKYINRNKLHFKIYKKTQKTPILNCNNISQYYCFTEDQKVRILATHKRLFFKNIKKIPTLNFSMCWPCSNPASVQHKHL